MTRQRTSLALPLLLAFEAAAVVVLHRLGEVPGLRAGTLVAAQAAPDDALMAAARVVALAVAWWLLATTLLCCAAHASRLPAAIRAVEWLALPAVRRLVQRTLAATLSLSAAAVPVSGAAGHAAAAGGAAAGAAVGAALPVPEVEGGVVLPPALAIAEGVPRAGPADVAPEPRPGRGNGLPRQHTVAEGEHLWGLARAAVGEATGRRAKAVQPAEVAAYWVRLIEANPSNLRSGDPDLVYPGDIVTLPPLED